MQTFPFIGQFTKGMRSCPGETLGRRGSDGSVILQRIHKKFTLNSYLLKVVSPADDILAPAPGITDARAPLD